MPDAAPPRPAAAGPGACGNCGVALLGPHCHACGQRHADRRLRLGEIAREASDELLGYDGRLWRTVRDLTLAPGDAIRAWVHGRRQSMVGPVRYYLGVVVVYFLVARFTGVPGLDTSPAMPGLTPDVDIGVEAYYEFFTTHLKVVTLLFLPLMALLFHAAFRSQGYDLAESFAFTLYSNGHATLFGLAGPIVLGITRDPAVTMAMTAALMVMMVAYLSWSARRFYGDTVPMTVAKVAAVYACWSIVLGLTMGSMLAIALLLS